MPEVWCPIPCWEERYSVSDLGRVRSADMNVRCRGGKIATRRGRVLTPVQKQGRYWAVTLANGHTRRQYLLHELVLLAFIGPRPEGLQVRHLDDNRDNNTLSNLRYGTPKANGKDKMRNGKVARGEKHGMARLRPKDILAIRASKDNRSDLGAQYRVTPSHIWSIQSRRTWRHI